MQAVANRSMQLSWCLSKYCDDSHDHDYNVHTCRVHEAIFPAHEKWEKVFVWISDADLAVLYSFHNSKNSGHTIQARGRVGQDTACLGVHLLPTEMKDPRKISLDAETKDDLIALVMQDHCDRCCKM